MTIKANIVNDSHTNALPKELTNLNKSRIVNGRFDCFRRQRRGLQRRRRRRRRQRRWRPQRR